MDRPKATPRDFFLWAGAMVALYGGVVAFISLLFTYIDYTLPNALQNYFDPYSGAAYQMAALIVLAPVFLILMRVIRRSIEQDPSRGEVWVRRWALFLTVFVAGATIVIDLIVLLTNFLGGEEMTVAFLLKVLVVLLVAGAGFMHFLADIWGYWVKNPSYARYINWWVCVLVILAIILGFFVLGTPAEARQYRMDERRVGDLQNIQSQLTYYFQQKQSLPVELAELEDPLIGFEVPMDPTTGEPYTYKRHSPLDFGLCAIFEKESRAGGPRVAKPYGSYGGESWEHAAGEACFDRSIDPAFYPKPAPVR